MMKNTETKMEIDFLKEKETKKMKSQLGKSTNHIEIHVSKEMSKLSASERHERS
ncbi:unnamed protein product [Camellia sinensis]